ELDFNTSRGIHSYIDFAHWRKTKVKVQKSFKDPGNPIDIFRNLPNRGVVELTENKIYDAKYVVKDIAGNCSELDFKIQNTVVQTAAPTKRLGILFPYDQENSYETDDVKINLSQGV